MSDLSTFTNWKSIDFSDQTGASLLEPEDSLEIHYIATNQVFNHHTLPREWHNLHVMGDVYQTQKSLGKTNGTQLAGLPPPVSLNCLFHVPVNLFCLNYFRHATDTTESWRSSSSSWIKRSREEQRECRRAIIITCTLFTIPVTSVSEQ